MKKWMAVMALLLAIGPITGMAAEASKSDAAAGRPDLTAGVKAGISMSTLSGDDIEGVSSKIGMAAGGFFGIGLGPVMIQPEVQYVQKGAQDEDNSDLKMKMDYLEIPVLIKAAFMGPEAKVRPSIYAGPALGILLGAKTDDGTNSVDVKDSYKSTDFGLAFGADIEIQGFIVDLRYTMGLSQIPDTGDSDLDVDVKNGAFMVQVGYSFL